MIAFSSTHSAISAQKFLAHICPVQTMPVLREVSSGCGIAVRFSPDYLCAVRSTLYASSLLDEEYAIYGVSGSGGTVTATKL